MNNAKKNPHNKALFILQFEGGLYTTALVVDGAYKLAAKEKKAPTMSDVSRTTITCNLHS